MTTQQSKKTTRAEFGQLLRDRRAELGYTQALTARMADVKPSELNLLESGTQRIAVEKVLRIIKVLGIHRTEAFLVVNGLAPLRKSIVHGSFRGYNSGCRCEACSATRLALARQGRAKRLKEGIDPNDPRHGKVMSLYNEGCRCEPCQILSARKRSKRIYYADTQERK
jgi:transcriptional regulator with XRE-family HTH domain